MKKIRYSGLTEAERKELFSGDIEKVTKHIVGECMEKLFFRDSKYKIVAVEDTIKDYRIIIFDVSEAEAESVRITIVIDRDTYRTIDYKYHVLG